MAAWGDSELHAVTDGQGTDARGARGKEVRLKRMWRGFWLGVLALSGLEAGIQDTYGLEGYIARVREHWMNVPPYVGFGAFAIALLVMVIEGAIRRAARRLETEAEEMQR